MVCVGTKQVDYLNRLMFTVKLVIMVAVLGLLLPRAEGQHLLSMPLGQGLLLAGLPVIFTSFGFHGSIPSVMLYLGTAPSSCAGSSYGAPPCRSSSTCCGKSPSWGCSVNNP